eukprot:387045_1
MSTQFKLICGFIREIKRVISTHLVPMEIIELCSAFYKPFIFKIALSASHNQLYLFEITPNQNAFTSIEDICLYPNITNSSLSYNKGCYIPNLLQFAPNVLKRRNINAMKYELGTNINEYDGLFCEQTKRNSRNSFTHCLVIFNTHRSNKFFVFRGYNEQNQMPEKYIYCGEKHGIIFNKSLSFHPLYQLKPDQMRLNKYNFNNMQTRDCWKGDRYWLHMNFLSICYLKKYEKIFAIQNKLTFTGPKHQSCVISGMYDFNDNTWRSAGICDYKWYLSPRFDLCDDNNNYVYAMDQGFRLMQYDLNKIKWNILLSNELQLCSSISYPHIWMNQYDSNTIFASMSCTVEHEHDRWFFFDKRDSGRKWMSLDCANTYFEHYKKVM